MLSSGWAFNGDHDKPTFTPSVLVTNGHFASSWKKGDPCWCTFNAENPGKTSFICIRCHSFVTGGQIQFLEDCTHALRGKSVALEPFPSSYQIS
jgi:hypothetical protein